MIEGTNVMQDWSKRHKVETMQYSRALILEFESLVSSYIQENE